LYVFSLSAHTPAIKLMRIRRDVSGVLFMKRSTAIGRDDLLNPITSFVRQEPRKMGHGWLSQLLSVSAARVTLARFLESATWKCGRDVAVKKYSESEMAVFSAMYYRSTGIWLGGNKQGSNDTSTRSKDDDTMNQTSPSRKRQP
jgi:hypothetical protein